DFGLKRAGIAVTDPQQIIVSGLPTVASDQLISFILRYADQEPIEALVIGYPFLEGAWGDPRFKTELDQFIAKLRKSFPSIPVHLQDERFTSMRAKEVILNSGRKKHQRRDKQLLNQKSAEIILQEYLGHI
ncbi:MAG TPA: Holliday junction resolvase RuvX, partial [Saprospiraceae bacterium]|nr:Holliday junction resolvase RuvX [Saprospiraceae bacterium]